MATVGIFGAGELGGAAADALARTGRVAGVLMIDAAGSDVDYAYMHLAEPSPRSRPDTG